MANDNTMLWVLGGGAVAYWLWLQSQPQPTAQPVAPNPGQTSGIISTTPTAQPIAQPVSKPSIQPTVVLPALQMCPGGGSPPCSGPILGNGGQPINLPINIAASPYFGGGPTYAPGSVDCAPPNYMSGGICYPPLIKDPRFLGGAVTLAGLGLGRLGRAPIRWSEANGIPIRRGR